MLSSGQEYTKKTEEARSECWTTPEPRFVVIQEEKFERVEVQTTTIDLGALTKKQFSNKIWALVTVACLCYSRRAIRIFNLVGRSSTNQGP